MHPEILADIIAFCPEGFTSVSKPLESERQLYLLNLIRKIERENLDQFSYLKGFSDFGVEKAPYRSTLISEVFKKIVGDITLIARANVDEPFSMDNIHNLLGRRDSSSILTNWREQKQRLEDESLSIVTNVLRRQPHNLLIPQGTLAEKRTWFNNDQNQEQLLAIKMLSLSTHELRWLPDEICNLRNLESLYLSISRFIALPESIRNLRNLKLLDISNVRLRVLPVWIGSLENLSILSLSHSELPALPESMRNLRNLKKLSLSCNRLKALPESVRNLRNLVDLDLSYNRLEVLPKWIGSLKNLSNLHLNNNDLTALPDSMRNLRNLSILDLGYNRFEVLPEWIGSLKNLSYLVLNNNDLTALPESMRNLRNLSSLDLRYNRLEVLPKWIGSLENLRRLNYMRFYNNSEKIKYTAIAAIAYFAYTFFTLQTIACLYSIKNENLAPFLPTVSMIILTSQIFFGRKIDHLCTISNDMKYLKLSETVASVAACFLFFALNYPDQTSV
jgi:Leucine-rich repeat (LRR) protein